MSLTTTHANSWVVGGLAGINGVGITAGTVEINPGNPNNATIADTGDIANGGTVANLQYGCNFCGSFPMYWVLLELGTPVIAFPVQGQAIVNL